MRTLLSLIIGLQFFTTHAIVVDTELDNKDLAMLAGDSKCSLREAVHAVNTKSIVDTCDPTTDSRVLFAPSVKRIMLDGKALPLLKNAVVSGENRLIAISGNNQSQIFVQKDINTRLELSFLALSQGQSSASTSSASNQTITCDDSGSAFGGAVCTEGDLTMTNVRINNSRTTGLHSFGGAVAVKGALTLENVSLANNASKSDGGAVYANKKVSISYSEFKNNESSGHGGAIAFNLTASEVVDIYDSYFFQNQSELNGGAIHLQSASPTSHANIMRTTLENNASQRGFGGAISSSMTLRMENSSVFGNVVKARGSAVFLTGTFADPTYRNTNFLHNTIVRNTAFSRLANEKTSAIYTQQNSHLLIQNNILTSNTRTETDRNASDCDVENATSLKFYNNLISENNSSCFSTTEKADNLVGQFSGRFSENSQCRRFIGVNGTTCPPVIKAEVGNAGIDKAKFVRDGYTDQRDLLRNIDGDGNGIRVPDIGAYEYNALPRVYTLSVNVSGLMDDMSLLLKNRASQRLTASPSRPFNQAVTFESKLSDGEVYELSVTTQPAFQTCLFDNNKEGIKQIVSGSHVTLNLTCSTPIQVKYPAGDQSFRIYCSNGGYAKQGSDVTCQVFTANDYVFVKWGGDCASTGSKRTCELKNIQTDKNINAVIQPRFYAVTVNPPQNGTLKCEPIPVEYNDDLVCTATPNAGYKFSNWDDDCANIQSNTPTTCELLEVKSTKAVSVIFVPINTVPMPFKDSFE